MKLISFYLPQFHEIPENNDAWGNGFTEWTNVKKSKPLFWGHNQPRVPLNQNYYNLLEDGVLEWQAKLAKKAGIYGFCFYHYWFNGRLVLEKPAEKLLHNPQIDLPFCFSWANESWTKTWHGAGGNKEILIAQTYGGQDEWKRHYNYFRPFFLDSRYIKENNCPILLIYQLKNIPQFNEMICYWNEKAKEDGFNGIFLVTMNVGRVRLDKSRWVNGSVDFEPNMTKATKLSEAPLIQPKENALLRNCFAIRTIDYDEINQKMLEQPHKKYQFRTAFVGYDDSPRRGLRAIVTRGTTPEKFGKYLRKTIEASKAEGNDIVFINAWNEWGEGNYLEPDERYGYSYLREVRKSLDK